MSTRAAFEETLVFLNQGGSCVRTFKLHTNGDWANMGVAYVADKLAQGKFGPWTHSFPTTLCDRQTRLSIACDEAVEENPNLSIISLRVGFQNVILACLKGNSVQEMLHAKTSKARTQV